MKSLQISEFISEVGTDNGTQDISSLSESESSSVVSDSLWPHGLYRSWNPPGQNTEVGSLSLLQGIFPTQGSNPSLPHCRQILYQLNHKGSPRILEWVASLFSSGSSWPRNQIGVSCIAGGFFTSWATRKTSIINIIEVFYFLFFILCLQYLVCILHLQFISISMLNFDCQYLISI